MTVLKKPKTRTIPPLTRRPLSMSQTQKDLMKRLEERNAAMAQKEKKKKAKK